jgi:hypothetical protein
MDKIASPKELATELRSILAYAEQAKPSRDKIATDLRALADRTASGESERMKAQAALTKALQMQYPDVPAADVKDMTLQAVSDLGRKIKDISKKSK